MTEVRSAVHVLAPDGGAHSIATIPLDAYGPGASATVVHVFGLWGLSQLLMALAYVVVLWRYRSLVPLMYLLMAVEYAGRLALAFAQPIETVGTAPGAVANWVMVPVAVASIGLRPRPVACPSTRTAGRWRRAIRSRASRSHPQRCAAAGCGTEYASFEARMNDPTPSDRPLPSGIAAPARRALTAAGIEHLAQLTDVTEDEVAALHGVGPKALRMLRAALDEAGWAFAPSRTAASNAVDAYLEGFDGAARAALEKLRELLRDAVPGATETMAYGIPTLDLDGDHVLHFAGFARHVGLYPTPSGMAAFDDELARYARGKGSVRFPLGQALPTDLVRRIAAFRVEEVAGAAPHARAAKARPARRARNPMSDAVRDALHAAGLMEAYRARPPYQRNDYLGWIAGAKREGTRTRRLRRMLDELAEGGTYMGMPWGPGSR